MWSLSMPRPRTIGFVLTAVVGAIALRYGVMQWRGETCSSDSARSTNNEVFEDDTD